MFRAADRTQSLGHDHAWHIRGTARRPEWIEQSGNREK